jgi:hypothetical protein
LGRKSAKGCKNTDGGDAHYQLRLRRQKRRREKYRKTYYYAT